MPPKKNASKTGEPVTSTTKPNRIRRVKNNTSCCKNEETPNKSILSSDGPSGNTHHEETPKKKIQEDILLSKRDINIILANEVLKTQFPSKIPSLDAIENGLVDDIEFPENIFKKMKKAPLSQKVTVKKNIVKRSTDLKVKKRKLLEKSSLSNQSSIATELEENNYQISNNLPVTIKKPRKLQLKKKLNQNGKLEKNRPALSKLKLNKKNCTSPTPEKPASKRGRPKKKVEGQCNVEGQTEPQVKSTNKLTKCPRPVKRKKNATQNLSRSSSCSDFSWARDISSGSASCVSVTSNEFVLIDNKLPIVKLKNLDLKPKSVNSSKQKTQSVKKLKVNKPVHEDKVDEDLKIAEIDVPDIALASPALSSSSSSSSSSSTSLSDNISCVKDNNTIEDLNAIATKLRSLDLEVITWTGFDSNSSSVPKLDNFKEKLSKLNALVQERNLLQKFAKYKEYNAKSNKENTINRSQDDDTFVKPNSVTHTNYKNRVSHGDNASVCALSSDSFQSQNNSNVEAPINNNKSQDDNDDDDALSLYAESITGLDSSRLSSSIPRVSDTRDKDEYVPEYVRKTSKVPVTFYKPSRIEITHEPEERDEKEECQNNVVPTVCEKQTADSTSLHRENENDKNTTENVIIYQDRQGHIEPPNFNANLYNVTKPTFTNPRLVTQNYKPGRTMFNFCYQNLNARCNNAPCKFNHIIPTKEEIEKKVAALDEHNFITEYMHMRGVPPLRRRFGICFLNECIKRKLTRLLVEVVIDFLDRRTDYSGADNGGLTNNVVERTLLYLNNVDLRVCHELLHFKLWKTGMLLCDCLLHSVAESPNFTRFIPIFIKLAWYVSGMDYRFDVQVATLLLERVCILPYEDKLARALIEVIKNTSVEIFYNAMIEKFEKMLMYSNKELYESFAFLKKRKLLNQSVVANRNTVGYSEKDVRYSPDTTNLDSVNKPVEPKFTRSVDNKSVPSANQRNDSSSNTPFPEVWNLPSTSGAADQSVFGAGQFQCVTSTPFPKGLQLHAGFKRRLNMSSAGNFPNKIRKTISGGHPNFKRGYTSMPSNSSSGSDERGPAVARRGAYADRGARGRGARGRHADGPQFRNARNTDGSRFFQ